MSGLQSNSEKIQFPIAGNQPSQENHNTQKFIINSEKRVDQTQQPHYQARAKALPVEKANQALLEFDIEEGKVAKPTWYDQKVVAGDTNQTVCLQNARILFEHGEYTLSKSLFQKMLLQDSRSSVAIFGLAQCFLKLNELEQSFSCFEQLHKIENDFYSLYFLGNINYQLGRYDQAHEIYLTVLQVAGFDQDLLFDLYKNLGNIQLRNGEVDGAIDNYNKAHRMRPDSDAIEINLGTAKLQRDELNEAISHFRRAVRFNPVSDMAWVGLALVHRRLADFDLAWANLERALDFAPDNKTALLLAVEWAKMDGRLEAILPLVRNFIAVNDQDDEVALLHSQILYAVGMKREALFEIERSMAMNPFVRGGENLLRMIRLEIDR